MRTRFRYRTAIQPILTMDMVRAYLKIDPLADASEDYLLTTFIQGAIFRAENFIGYPIQDYSAEIEYTFDDGDDMYEFKAGSSHIHITSIYYQDDSDITVDLTADDYTTQMHDDSIVICIDRAVDFGLTTKITVTATVQVTDLDPTQIDWIRMALLKIIADAYETREDPDQKPWTSVNRHLAQIRRVNA